MISTIIFRLVNETSPVLVPSHMYMIMSKCSDIGQSVTECAPINVTVLSFVLPHVNSSINNCMVSFQAIKTYHMNCL